MATERVEPEVLAPAELDEYLARGWYRMGQALITTDLLAWRGELRSTIWTRLDVRGHRFPRSVRKLMASNGRRFQVRVGALVMDDAREALYARYLEKVGGERVDNLLDVVGGAAGLALFDTREISVWSEDRLIAFSWFDLGERSAESLIGVYDPAYGKHSLGLYTLALEIVHTAALGRQFHYAGYVLAEPSSMDYKLQVGGLQFLDPATGDWLAAPPFPPTRSPAEVLRSTLAAAEGALTRSGVEVARYTNPALQIRGLLQKAPQCPPHPLLLVCGATAQARVVLVVWEPRREAYALLRARPVVAVLHRAGDGEGTPPLELRLFFVEAQIGESPDADEVADLARGYLAWFAPGRGG
jgi:arginine-tRNA-protein transferase